MRLWGETQYSLLERQWTRPALTVIVLEAAAVSAHRTRSSRPPCARLSFRTVPGMDAREAGRLILKKLTSKPEHGVR